MTRRTCFNLFSPLPRKEVVRLLRESVDREWALFGTKPVIGRVSRNAFSLRMRISGRNNFRPILRGHMTEKDGGTRIKCRAGISRFTFAFMAVWFSFTMLIALAAWQGERSDWVWTPNLIPLFALPIAGVAMVVLFKWMARHELDQLVSFLEGMIDAEQVD